MSAGIIGKVARWLFATPANYHLAVARGLVDGGLLLLLAYILSGVLT